MKYLWINLDNTFNQLSINLKINNLLKEPIQNFK